MKLAPAPLPAQQWRWDGHGQFIWAIHFTITSNKYPNLSFPFLIGVGAWDRTCVTCDDVTRVVMSHKTRSSWHWNSLIQVRLTFASQQAAQCLLCHLDHCTAAAVITQTIANNAYFGPQKNINKDKSNSFIEFSQWIISWFCVKIKAINSNHLN